jgi:hypothetical protein
MISRLDDKLRLEIRHFRLCYTCERCVQLDEATGRCSLGYPNEAHRDRPLDSDNHALIFCKEFELA